MKSIRNIIKEHLYESVTGIPDDLKLIFDPPIYNSHDFKNVMRVFNLKYPNLKWRGGEDCLYYNPFETDYMNEEDSVSIIQIKYGKLGYLNTGEAEEFEDIKKSKDGWKWIQKNDTDFDMTSRLFDSLNESVNPNDINKYKVGDQLLANTDLAYNDGGGERFVTGGQIYEIIRVEDNYSWLDYGYRGNKYVLHTDNRTKEGANHGFSDGYIDNNFTYIPKGVDLDINYDTLYESEEDEIENHNFLFKYNFLRDINLVGMEFRYDGEIYRILKNVDEDGKLLLTNPHYGTETIGYNPDEFLKYELEILIDALNRGDHAELVLDDINLDNLYDNLNESDDSLQWAEDLINSIPELPKVDGKRRVVRTNNDLTLEYLGHIMSLLSNNGYYFRSGRVEHQVKEVRNILNNGGYLHLNPDGRLSHGSGEESFIEITDGLRFSDVPNIFI